MSELVTFFTALGALLIVLEGIRSARKLDERIARIQECLRHSEEDIRTLRTRQDLLATWIIDIERRTPAASTPLKSGPPTM
jgi:hypothetical protein